MDGDQYRLIAGHPLREVLGNLVGSFSLPTKSGLRAQLEEALPGDDEGTEKLRGALFAKGVELAKAAQDRSRRFELRGKADQMTLEVLEGLRDADRLVAPEEDEEIDMDALMRSTDKYSDMIGGDREREHDREVEEARELVRKAGL